MKHYLYTLTAILLLIGCQSSRPRDDNEKQDPSYYNLIQFGDQGRSRTVYEGDISHILGDYRGGTIVMKNGSQFNFARLDWMTIERINKRHYEATHLPKKDDMPFTDSVNQQYRQ
jgi:hypothetical protein